MSTTQRLLLALSLLIAGGAIAGALILGGGESVTQPSLNGPEPGTSLDPEPPTPTNLGGPSPASRVSAAGGPSGQLIIRVINHLGASVPAEVHLTGSEGEEIYAEGSTTWKEFPVGVWELRTRTDELIVHRETIEVLEGKTTRITAQLKPTLEVRGQVIDRFGQGVGPTKVWFMRRDQVHPADQAAARKVHSTTTDSRGVFKAKFEKRGSIRMSVGKPGKMLVESDPIEFHSGGPKQITAVVAGTGRIEIELESPPKALAEGKANLVVSVISERGERAGGPRKRRTGTKKRKGSDGGKETKPRQLLGGSESGKGRAAKADEAAPLQGEGDPGVPPDPPQTQGAGEATDETAWSTLAEARVPAEGRVSFQALPPDRDLIIELTRRGDRFRSQPFRLTADRASIVRFRVPPKRDDDTQASQPFGDLTASVQERPLPQDAPEIGFTWE